MSYSVNSTNIAPIAYGTVTPINGTTATISNSYGTIGNATWDNGWVINLSSSYTKIIAVGTILFTFATTNANSPTIYNSTNTTSTIKMMTGKYLSSTNSTFIADIIYSFNFVVFGSN